MLNIALCHARPLMTFEECEDVAQRYVRIRPLASPGRFDCASTSSTVDSGRLDMLGCQCGTSANGASMIRSVGANSHCPSGSGISLGTKPVP